MATSKNERLLNLVICLMSARNYVTAEYLRKNVVGYSDAEQTKESLHEFKLATEQLNEAISGLQSEVSRFRISS